MGTVCYMTFGSVRNSLGSVHPMSQTSTVRSLFMFTGNGISQVNPES